MAALSDGRSGWCLARVEPADGSALTGDMLAGEFGQTPLGGRFSAIARIALRVEFSQFKGCFAEGCSRLSQGFSTALAEGVVTCGSSVAVYVRNAGYSSGRNSRLGAEPSCFSWGSWERGGCPGLRGTGGRNSRVGLRWQGTGNMREPRVWFHSLAGFGHALCRKVCGATWCSHPGEARRVVQDSAGVRPTPAESSTTSSTTLEKRYPVPVLSKAGRRGQTTAVQGGAARGENPGAAEARNASSSPGTTNGLSPPSAPRTREPPNRPHALTLVVTKPGGRSGTSTWPPTT